jgi:hypothetical protein
MESDLMSKETKDIAEPLGVFSKAWKAPSRTDTYIMRPVRPDVIPLQLGEIEGTNRPVLA